MTLRVIGGDLGGRKVRYNGNRNTRPMRDSVRENLFNIIGQRISDAVVFDPFCGTGILVAESFSRGAKAAVAMEFDRRAVKQIEENLESLDLTSRTTLMAGDAFRGLGGLMKRFQEERPWVFLLCPPYEMFQSRIDDLNRMIQMAASICDDGVLVAEADKYFDPSELTEASWDIRTYGITQLAVTDLSSVQIQSA